MTYSQRGAGCVVTAGIIQVGFDYPNVEVGT